jgi:hypothetical protein
MNDETATAVIEAEASPLQALETLVQDTEADYTRLQAQYQDLWRKRQDATLDREGYVDYLWTEDQMRVALKTLEALKPRLLYAQAEDAITQGKAHFDAHCAPLKQAGEVLCQRWVDFVAACAEYRSLADEQIALLWALPAQDGQPAFDLPDGSVTLQRMLNAFPHQPSTLTHSVMYMLREPMTVGQSQQVLEQITGQYPFSPGLVARFLQGYHVPESTPTEEGVTHASNP